MSVIAFLLGAALGAAAVLAVWMRGHGPWLVVESRHQVEEHHSYTVETVCPRCGMVRPLPLISAQPLAGAGGSRAARAGETAAWAERSEGGSHAGEVARRALDAPAPGWTIRHGQGQG